MTCLLSYPNAQFPDSIIRYATSANDFDFTQLRKQKMSFYTQIPESDKERLNPILTLFWAWLITSMTEQEPDKINELYDVLTVLDEFGNLVKLDKLKNGISF